LKENVLIGKFIAQTFHVAERARSRAPPWNLFSPPLGRGGPPVKSHCSL